ncbi:small secreted protein [Metarhizium guizhouense ARSEF 977]|uniref:Small secreted protein n=1 Tax=Metarhizium guizhouense (strain ARSEF 977) TaxID=1276136 RepID=A0A0B4GXA0_METGA|nr:small secreted protein [Metarhizium guizhouense ARSEF 977]
MKATQSILAGLLASSAVAMPAHTIQPGQVLETKAEFAAQFNPAPVPRWTVQEARRACAQDDSLCTWRFLMDTHVAAKTDVTFVVHGPGASRNNGGAQNVGDFTFTSGYDAAGFTTFAAVDNKRGLIAFPAYSDADVANGRVAADRDYDVYYVRS